MTDTTSKPHYSTLPEDTEARIPVGARAGGRYEIVRELGRGGTAVVYEARELHSSRSVAFKVVTSRADAFEAHARYENEARLAASLLGHPNVVRTIECGRLDGPAGFEGRSFLVTELIDGQPLSRVLSGHWKGMPIERVCTIAADVATALVSLHERGIVHRDVKPGNILVTGEDGNEHAQLIDFGFAYATGDGEAKSPDLTTEGRTPGTPLYMSPQQAFHLRPVPAFDVYALGITLYELLIGDPPNSRASHEALMLRKCDPERPVFPIAGIRPDIPAALAELVDRCLAYEPEDRPTAAEVLEVLVRVAGRDVEPVLSEPAAAVSVDPEVHAGTDDEETYQGSTEESSEIGDSAVGDSAVGNPPVGQARGNSRAIALLVAALVLGVTGVLVWLIRPGPGLTAPPEIGHSSAAPYVETNPAPEHAGSLVSPPTQPKDQEPPEVPLPEPASPVIPEPARPAASPNEPVVHTPDPDKALPGPSSAEEPVPKPPPAQPEQDPKACGDSVAEARSAADASQWHRVLRLSKKATCWDNAAERVRLRTEALLETEQYAKCIEAARGSTDRIVIRWSAICEDRITAGVTP